MTVTSSITTIASSIAGISISGITLKDIDEIPETASMLCPLMIPNPQNYVSDYQMTFETFGSAGTAKMNSTYSLNYIYLHCEVGSGINAFAPFSGVYSSLGTILVAIFTNDVIAGLVDMSLGGLGNIGVITDPAGNEYWGVMFSLKVQEFNQ